MTKIISASDFSREDVTLKDLVSWYNDNAGDNDKVTRFSDRKSAEKRCAKLMSQIDDMIEQQEETAELSDEEWEAQAKAELLKSAVEESIVDETRVGDGEVRKVSPAPERRLASNSLGIEASWKIEEVKNRRLTRNRVLVNATVSGELLGDFRSVREAFAQLGLPEAKHIKFRMELKSALTNTFEWEGKSYDFKII